MCSRDSSRSLINFYRTTQSTRHGRQSTLEAEDNPLVQATNFGLNQYTARYLIRAINKHSYSCFALGYRTSDVSTSVACRLPFLGHTAIRRLESRYRQRCRRVEISGTSNPLHKSARFESGPTNLYTFVKIVFRYSHLSDQGIYPFILLWNRVANTGSSELHPVVDPAAPTPVFINGSGRITVLRQASLNEHDMNSLDTFLIGPNNTAVQRLARSRTMNPSRRG